MDELAVLALEPLELAAAQADGLERGERLGARRVGFEGARQVLDRARVVAGDGGDAAGVFVRARVVGVDLEGGAQVAPRRRRGGGVGAFVVEDGPGEERVVVGLIGRRGDGALEEVGARRRRRPPRASRRRVCASRSASSAAFDGARLARASSAS